MTYPILLLAVALAGKPVAIPSDAEPSTKLAASELTNYLFRITGKVSEVKVKGAIERSEIAEGLREQWNASSIVVGTLKTLKDTPAAAKEALAETEDIEAAWTGTDGDGQWLYVTGHMLWNPDIDEMALFDDAESKYYGVAYPAMKEYHALRRKLWAEGRGCMGYPRGDQRRPSLLDALGAKEKLLGCLDEADRLAGDDKVLKFRLARDRRWLQTWWIDPNEEFKKKMSQAIYAPKTSGRVTIDGIGFLSTAQYHPLVIGEPKRRFERVSGLQKGQTKNESDVS